MTEIPMTEIPSASAKVTLEPRPYPSAVRRESVGPLRAMTIAYRVVLGQLKSPGRIIALLSLSLTVIVAGFAIGTSDTSDITDGASMIANLGFAVIIPVVCLVFAGGALGDLREDKTLVYLWLRPMDRWPIVVGAALAALTLAAPITFPPVVVAAALTRVGGGLVGATVIATLVALVAYTSIFTLLGVALKRHIVWGLAYILIWEGFIALGGRGVAQFAIRKYTRSILADQTGASLRTADFSTITGIIVPLVVSAAVLVLASFRLARQDID
jgi:ABC-2 type transport system permease protein